MFGPDEDPIDKQLLWTNLVGISLVTILLGLFGWFYGSDLLSFLVSLMNPAPFPGH